MMTPQQFHEQFPTNTTTNANCLLDIACPRCGQRDRFFINANVTVEVTEDGTGDIEQGFEWDETSHCLCGECKYGNWLAGFMIAGLDDFLSKKGD